MQFSSDFVRGEYRRVVESQFDTVGTSSSRSRRKGADASTDISTVGALCFLGRYSDAVVFYGKLASEFDVDHKSAAQFFLGLGCIRLSKYRKAGDHFKKAWNCRKETRSHVAWFFAYHSLGFLFHYKGEFSKSYKYSQKAISHAVAGEFLWGRPLAMDIFGHAQVRLGEIQSGISTLKEARKILLGLENTALVGFLTVSILEYECAHGLNGEKAIEILKKAMAKLRDQDTVSRMNIWLEMARQTTLAGKFQETRNILNELSKMLYVFRNTRQEITFHLRFAELEFVCGNTSLALNHLRTTELFLNSEMDRELHLKILGLLHKVLSELGQEDRKEEIIQQLLQLSPVVGSVVNQRIMLRNHLLDGETIPAKYLRQDPLGSLLDELQNQKPETLFKIQKFGYWSLLIPFFNLEKGKMHLIYSAVLKKLVCCTDQGIFISEKSISELNLKILWHLSQGSRDKETLLKNVWGYSYDPLRHDPMIYSAIGSLRKALTGFPEIILLREQHYSLLDGLRVLFFLKPAQNSLLVDPSKKLPQEKLVRPPQFIESLALVKDDLNFRQVLALRELREREFMDVHDYIDLFGISETTASRDLADMTKKGYVKRLGRARATKYFLPSEDA